MKKNGNNPQDLIIPALIGVAAITTLTWLIASSRATLRRAKAGHHSYDDAYLRDRIQESMSSAHDVNEETRHHTEGEI